MGLAEAAHGGDLFIDEIEALPLSQQPKLLRFLENGEIRRVGARETSKIQTRVIAATNQNLQRLVKEGKFREDLFFRLNGKKINIPTLKNRKADIPDLCQHFISLEKPKRNKSFADDAIEELKKYDWPGNVRELKRVCEQLTQLAPLPIIRAIDVKHIINPAQLSAADAPASIDLTKDLNTLLVEYEIQIVKKVMQIEPDIDLAAKKLGISRSSLYKKLNDYNIKPEKN
jgi:DNA-binding NtrC family response regulator